MCENWTIIDGTEGKYEYNREDNAVRNARTKRTVGERVNNFGHPFYRLYFGGRHHDITTRSIRKLRTCGDGMTKTCIICGQKFETNRANAKFCSKRCKKRNDNVEYNGFHVKRARKYGVGYEHGITLPMVIEKYDGICQGCGKKVDKGKYQDMPTIDHIIALKNGGSHTWDNVQLLCMACNSKKAAHED